MRGIADNNAPAFAEAAAHLRALGHEVWSPVEHDQQLQMKDEWQHDIRFFMKRDLAALMEQDAVVLLDDWTRSNGACLEAHCADVVGIPRFLFEPRVEGALVPVSTHDWRWRAALAGSSR